MANPPGMKVLTVKSHGLLEDFQSLRTLRGVQLSPFVFASNRAFECGPLQGGRHLEGACVSGPRSLELSTQVRREHYCTTCIHA